MWFSSRFTALLGYDTLIHPHVTVDGKGTHRKLRKDDSDSESDNNSASDSASSSSVDTACEGTNTVNEPKEANKENTSQSGPSKDPITCPQIHTSRANEAGGEKFVSSADAIEIENFMEQLDMTQARLKSTPALRDSRSLNTGDKRVFLSRRITYDPVFQVPRPYAEHERDDLVSQETGALTNEEFLASRKVLSKQHMQIAELHDSTMKTPHRVNKLGSSQDDDAAASLLGKASTHGLSASMAKTESESSSMVKLFQGSFFRDGTHEASQPTSLLVSPTKSACSHQFDESIHSIDSDYEKPSHPCWGHEDVGLRLLHDLQDWHEVGAEDLHPPFEPDTPGSHVELGNQHENQDQSKFAKLFQLAKFVWNYSNEYAVNAAASLITPGEINAFAEYK